jgi:hypothetical protein
VVTAAKGEEFLVSSSFGDAAVVEDQYLVGVSNRVHAIADDQRCTSTGAKPFFDLGFGLRIECGSCTVKHQYSRVPGEASCDLDSLSLPAAEITAVFLKGRIEPPGPLEYFAA